MSRQEEEPPASPTVMMPTSRELEPSPTTGLASRGTSQQSLDVQTPRTEPAEDEDLTDEDSYGIYEDLPSADYGKHSHISLEDLGEDAHPVVSAGLVSHSTIEGIVSQLFLCIFLCLSVDIPLFLVFSPGIDVTIEGEIGRAASEPEVSTSQGFSVGFPSPTPTAEVGEGSGMNSLSLC